MAKIYSSFDQLIGNTPLLDISGFIKGYGGNARVLAKLECMNPAGSVKDRVALRMIEDAEGSGRLKSGGTVIEPTSGNTGIGLAAVCACRGYRSVIVMPDSMSQERIKTIRAYGAQVVLTPGALGMQGAIDKAQELLLSTEGAIIAGQFENPSNPAAHSGSTGPEIWNDTDGKVDIFVAGIGTGGTITGVGEYLKGKNSNIKVIGVEPASSRVLMGESPSKHAIQGIGANFVPAVLNTDIYDELHHADDTRSMELSREFARCCGIMVGISSGAALDGAIEVAKRPENAGKTVVVLLPDGGGRYLSTDLYD